MSFLRQFFSTSPPTVVPAKPPAVVPAKPPAVAPTLPEGWEKHVDSKTNHPYYVNAGLSITQWAFPNSSSAAAASLLLQKLPPALSVAPAKPVAAPAAPAPTQDPCTNPSDPDDLYYYISSQNGQGPYIPVSEDELWKIARKATGNESNQRDDMVYTKWTTGDIPNTNATGCMSQNLGGNFGVRVDGLNKVIIDAYNATLPNRPPIETLVPLKTKYFYYIRLKRDKEYLSRSLILINRLGKDHDWKSGKIPNTNATGLMWTARNGNVICVRVDRANNAIIEAYNESLKKPLPPGWEDDGENYKNPDGNVQEVRPTSEAPEPIPSSPLPPGWEYLKDKSGRISYGNPTLKIVQWDRPDDLPSGWKEFREEASGKLYYKNTSGIVQYDRPLPPLPPGWKEMHWNKQVYYVYPTLGIQQEERPLQLPSGWQYMKDKRGKLYYVNPILYTAQYAFPTTPSSSSTSAPVAVQPLVPAQSASSAPATPDLAAQISSPSASTAAQTPTSTLPPLPPGWEELREPSGQIYYGNPELKVVQYDRPMVYKMGDKTFSSFQLLMKEIKSLCTQDTRECDLTVKPVAGGSKNKKHGRGTKRRHKASRRKASRRGGRKTHHRSRRGGFAWKYNS